MERLAWSIVEEYQWCGVVAGGKGKQPGHAHSSKTRPSTSQE